MRQFPVILLLLLTCRSAFCQTNEFAPVGAKWWYGLAWNGIDFETMFYFVESVKDTIVFEKNCRKLSSKKIFEFTEEHMADFYIYQSNDTVYYAIEYLFGEQIDTAFHILYNFNAQVNDTTELHRGDYSGISPEVWPDDTTDYIVIDSIGSEIIAGFDLKKVSFHSEMDAPYGCWMFDGSAYEMLGRLNYLLPLPLGCFVKDPFPDFLQCYEDPNVGTLHFWGDRCVYFSDISTSQQTVSIYPNPATNFVKINSKMDITNLEIYSTDGILIQTYKNATSIIDVSHLSPGHYTLQIQAGSEIYYLNMIKIL